jgi:multicomponent Na+:H+ antiporter subunit F
MSGRSDILDIALIYALISFIGVVAVLKLVEQGNFHTPGGDDDQERPEKW